MADLDNLYVSTHPSHEGLRFWLGAGGGEGSCTYNFILTSGWLWRSSSHLESLAVSRKRSIIFTCVEKRNFCR